MHPTRFVVLGNAAAGSASEEAVAQATEVLGEAADVRSEQTEDPGEIDRVLDGVAEDELLVVVGGDGSLHAVAQALHRTGRLAGTTIGLVPLGTGNDLARCLGLPLDAADAARVVRSGRSRALDVLVDDEDGVVVNAVHAGIGAAAAEAAEEWKSRLGAPGYVIGSAVAGVREQGWRLRVTVDGEALVDGAEPVLMVGLGIGRSIGGGALLTPDAEPDDGLVDVVVATSTGPLARVGFAVALREGVHVDRDDVVTARGREVTVTAAGADDAYRVNADGEVSADLTRRTWRVLRQVWSILA